MSANDRKTGGDDVLALALARGDNLVTAAAACGVSERTVRRRLAQPEFRRRVEQLRGEMGAGALGQLTDSMTGAVTTLKCLLDAKAEAVRLGAARALVELGLKVRDQVELERRLAEVEGRLALLRGAAAPGGGNGSLDSE